MDVAHETFNVRILTHDGGLSWQHWCDGSAEDMVDLELYGKALLDEALVAERWREVEEKHARRPRKFLHRRNRRDSHIQRH